MKTIFVIGGHPDNIEISCSNSLALKHQQGYRIINFIVISGEEDSINYVEAVKGLAAYRGIMTMKSGYAEVFEVLRCDLLRA